MAENVLDSGPPSAKRPKLSSPALSASASDGNGKFFSLISLITVLLVHFSPFWLFGAARGSGEEAGLLLCFCRSVLMR